MKWRKLFKKEKHIDMDTVWFRLLFSERQYIKWLEEKLNDIKKMNKAHEKTKNSKLVFKDNK